MIYVINNIFGSQPIRDVTRMMSLLIRLDLAKNLLNIWNAFQYKYSISGLWYSNYKHKTVVSPYLYNGDTYTVKTTFLFWNGPLLSQSFILFVAKSDFCWKIWIIPRCRLVGNHKRPLFRICGLLGCQRFWELRMIYVKEQLPWNGRCSFGKTASVNCTLPLQWRHNERDGVSNHRCLNCLLNHFLWRKSKKTSKLWVTGPCEGNPRVTSNAENVSIWWLHGRKFIIITHSWKFKSS